MVETTIILCCINMNGKLSKKESFLIIFFGIVCFGITLTNYFFYLIGLILILICRYNFKEGIKKFVNINIINLLLIILLCLFQKSIWKESPLFWTSIINGIQGNGYEEIMYMNWNFGLDKLIILLKNFLFYPLLSPSIQYTISNVGISFSSYKFIFLKIMLIILSIIFIYFISKRIFKALKNKLKEDLYIIFIFISLIGNLCLHYVYGYWEAFIYSPHFIFLLLLLAAESIQNLKKKKNEIIIYTFLLLFTFLQIINNFIYFFKTAILALKIYHRNLNLMMSFKGVILCSVILIIIYVLIYYIKDRNKSELSENLIINDFYKFILIYIMFLFLIGFILLYNLSFI